MSKKRIVYFVIFILFVAFLLFAPRGNILQTDVLNTFAGSSAAHPLGTDNIGRDVYSLILEDRTMSKYSYWDGKILKDPDNRKYYLFASCWDQK
ncbi:MAG: hypothetical protein IJH61_06035, partial [Eubacteriaceae bacterium]|nr:hypothetical protein [Eubacteriaceae bacterium]